MQTIKPGKLIVIEGLEGAGKSTAMRTIHKLLLKHGLEVITTREPGGTVIAEQIRTLLKEPVENEALDPLAETLLFYAARVQLIQQVMLPALTRGAWILADRFEMSTFAYQGGGRQVDANLLQQLSDCCVHGMQPDLTLFLNISPEVGLQRALKRGKLDRIEQESVDFFNRVYATYQQHSHNMPRVVVIDASQPLLTVQSCLREELKQYLRINHDASSTPT